jgi:uncharacterized protein (DUF433 family)
MLADVGCGAYDAVMRQEKGMAEQQPLNRVIADPDVCGGQPCIRGTRINIAVILDGLAEGLTPEEIIDHYPQLNWEDIRGALAYAAELSRENLWKVPAAP